METSNEMLQRILSLLMHRDDRKIESLKHHGRRPRPRTRKNDNSKEIDA